jgi:hypothetical protein
MLRTTSKRVRSARGASRRLVECRLAEGGSRKGRESGTGESTCPLSGFDSADCGEKDVEGAEGWWEASSKSFSGSESENQFTEVRG